MTHWRVALGHNALHQHGAWLAERPGGARLILSGLEVGAAQLQGADLRLSCCEDSTLRGVNLIASSLQGWEARRVKLVECALEFTLCQSGRWEEVELERCHAVGLHLEGARWRGGAVRESSLARSSWDQAEVEGVCLAGVCLRDAKLGRARFLRCDLRGADLRGAQLEQARFEDCQTEGALGLSEGAEGPATG